MRVEAKAQPIIIVGYHIPGAGHKDYTPLEALANILGQGRSSRLYQLLVKEKRVAAAVVGLVGFPGDKFPNLLAVYAVPSPGHKAAECLELMDEEIIKIKNDPVSSDELNKYKRGAIKNLLDQMKSNSRMAALLTYAEVVLGNWQLLFDQIKSIQAVTPEDIQRVANNYLVNKHRTVAEIVPEK